MDTLAKTLINSAEIKKARGAREGGRQRGSHTPESVAKKPQKMIVVGCLKVQ